MNKARNNRSKEVHNRSNRQHTNSKVQQGNASKSKVTKVETNTINNSLSSYSCELGEANSYSSEYTQEVMKAIKDRIKINIDIMNKVFDQTNKELIPYDEEDSIANMASNALDGYFKIREYGLFKVYEKIALEPGTLLVNIVNEAYMNGTFCWRVLQSFCDSERKVLLEFNIKKSNYENARVIEGLDSTIDKMIEEFKKIKAEYFSILRLLLDPSIKVEKKHDEMIKFNPEIQSRLINAKAYSKSVGEYINQYSAVLQLFAQSLSGDLFRLINLIEGLSKFKYAPKTLENSKIVYGILVKCFSNHYKTVDFNQFSRDSKYTECRVTISNLFRESLGPMLKGMMDATKEENLLLQKRELSNQIVSLQNQPSITNSQNEKLESQAEAKAIISENVYDLYTLKDKQTIEIHKELNEGPNKDLKIENEINTAPQKEEVNFEVNVIQTPINNTIEVVVNNAIEAKVIEIVIEEEDLDDIEEENNGLMEALRRFYEKDRVEKQKLKQERLMKSKKTIINNEDDKIIIDSLNKLKLSIPILSQKKQELVIDLFRKPLPPYRTILGKKVKSLISYLGGICQGNKGNFEIYWGNSNKKAGDFEICHEGDTNGYVTPEYSKRVADAIYAGVVTYGTISKDYFTPELLNLIENHEAGSL